MSPSEMGITSHPRSSHFDFKRLMQQTTVTTNNSVVLILNKVATKN